MDQVELEQASRLMRRYADFGMDIFVLWPDDFVPATEEHRRVAERLWWAHKQSAPSNADVESMLETCGITGLPEAAVQLLSDVICNLMLPRWDDPGASPYGKAPNLPEEVLRRLLPAVSNAANEFGLNAMSIAVRETRFIAMAVRQLSSRGMTVTPPDSWHGLVETGDARLTHAREQAAAVIQLMEAIERLQLLLPPPLPRKFAPWHDDARSLGNSMRP